MERIIIKLYMSRHSSFHVSSVTSQQLLLLQLPHTHNFLSLQPFHAVTAAVQTSSHPAFIMVSPKTQRDIIFMVFFLVPAVSDRHPFLPWTLRTRKLSTVSFPRSTLLSGIICWSTVCLLTSPVSPSPPPRVRQSE